MKKITEEENKRIMLNILKDVAEFCDKENLAYYLTGGTLIGAIRHKGFIPWDDDIDIAMPRPDYNKFISLYQEKGKYSLSTPADKGCFCVWAKVYDSKTLKFEDTVDYSRFKPLGVDIDIFPIDGQPAQYEEFKKDTDRRMHFFSWLTLARLQYKGQSFKRRLKIFISRCIGVNFFKRKYVESAEKLNFYNSEMVGVMDPFSKTKHHHRKEIFAERVKVSFEDGMFWAPAGYDEYLTNIFGDYMKLPPVEKQVTHHRSNLFWK